MAKPKTAASSKLLILLGDGATPEVFTAPCGLTTKGLNFSAETNDVMVPDCDNPDDPAWTERVVSSLSGTITGSGVLAMESLPVWRAFFFSGAARNCRVRLAVPLADNGGHFEGRFLLTSFEITGEIGNKVQVSVELMNDGEVAWVAATS